MIPHNEEPYYTCADRYAIDVNTRAIAIADGVGGSLYPSFLSERITKDFVKNPSALFDVNTHSLTNDYSLEFETYYQRRYRELSPVKQQILDLKAEQTKASSCTFVGCYLEGNRWNYYALGDSYLFFVDKNGQMSKFSSMEGKEFDVFPEYFSTSGKHNGEPIFGNLPIEDGILMLMTDALSDWFIKYYEEDKSLLNRLLLLNNHKEYKELCNSELASGRLHDDDCALLIVKIDNAKDTDVIFSIKNLDDITDLSEKELQELVQKKENEKREIILKFDELSQEHKKAQLELDEANRNLTKAKEEYSKTKQEDDQIIAELRNQIHNPVSESKANSPIIELGEIKSLGLKLQEIEGIINKKIGENSKLESFQQLLWDIKEGINTLLQYVKKEDETMNESGLKSHESEDDSKKKIKKSLDGVIRYSYLLFDCVIIILMVLFFLFK